MSVLTTTPLKSAPSAGTGVAITTGASWAYGAWVQVLAATAAPTAIAGVQLTGGTYSSQMWELDLGVGAAGAEVSIGTLRLFLYSSGQTGGPIGLLLPLPLGGIGSGVRVAVRARSAIAQGPATVALNYYENLSSDQVASASQVLGSAPSGSGTASLTPSATPWANSAWVQLIASAPADLGLLGIVHGNAGAATEGVEYDLGTGASGAEVVITTLRETTPAAKILYTWLPGVYPLATGTRLAIRMRKSDTSTSAHPVAVLYYSGVSATPPVSAQITQSALETLVSGTGVAAAVTQSAIEALITPVAAAEITQSAIEVLMPIPPGGGGEVPAGPPPQVNPIPQGVVRLFFELRVGHESSAVAVMSAETTLSDPGFWFYGLKPGRLLTATIDPRELTETGDFRGVTARITLADIAGTFRQLANTSTLAGAYGALYAVADDVRYAHGEPARLFAGKVSTHRAKPGFQYEFTLTDLLSEYVADLDASPRVPPDRLSKDLFPLAAANDGMAMPIVLGKSSDRDELDIPSNAQGVVPAKFLGTTNLNALDPTAPDVEVDAYVWSQSAIVWRGLTEIFYNEPDHPETRYLVPESEFGVNAWTPGHDGWPAPPYPQYLEYAGHRYTPLLVRHSHPLAQAIRDGNTLLAANLYGIAEVADGSGRYFDDAASLWQWLIVNQLYVPYTVGDYAPVPTLTPGYGIIDTASVARARAVHDARIPGGYVVGFLLGRDGQQQTLRHVLGELCFGTDMQQGINRHGQAMVSVCDPAAPVVAVFTDRADIEDGTFEQWVDREGWFDQVEFTYGFRYWPPGAPKAAPAEGAPLPATTLPAFNEWTSGLKTLPHADAIAAHAGQIKTLRLENYVVRDTATALDWATTRLANAVGPAPAYDGARMFRFTTGWQGLAVELGDVIRMDHLEGYTPSCTGYVTKITIDPQKARITLEGRVFPPAPPAGMLLLETGAPLLLESGAPLLLE